MYSHIILRQALQIGVGLQYGSPLFNRYSNPSYEAPAHWIPHTIAMVTIICRTLCCVLYIRWCSKFVPASPPTYGKISNEKPQIAAPISPMKRSWYPTSKCQRSRKSGIKLRRSYDVYIAHLIYVRVVLPETTSKRLCPSSNSPPDHDQHFATTPHSKTLSRER